jgi:hypothetical protein
MVGSKSAIHVYRVVGFVNLSHVWLGSPICIPFRLTMNTSCDQGCFKTDFLVKDELLIEDCKPMKIIWIPFFASKLSCHYTYYWYRKINKHMVLHCIQQTYTWLKSFNKLKWRYELLILWTNEQTIWILYIPSRARIK